ncbi:MAG: hypothetical protein QOF44_4734 [Streptomyces sp.]|jgi:acyl-CoA synthetase (AMP-forming)/AMP-acid ligase II|nr:hypothetical protein [Streptomyces sp.]
MANLYRNFAEVMLARAAEDGGRDALVLLGEEREDETRRAPETVSYGELDRSARALAGWLQDKGAAGERVLVLQNSRRLFAVSFLACLYAGAIAVPAPPPGGRVHHDERVASIVKDAAVSLALTSAAEAPEVSRLMARTGYGHVGCVAVDALAYTEDHWRAPDLDGRTTAFLQYTSGSTREPRGVVVTHGNLLDNQQAISRALGTRPRSRLGGWLPFHHDMGLVGQLLHPLWLGGTSVLLTPTAFVKRPISWLRAISRYRIAVSGAPDFAYDLCLRRVSEEQAADLDLSCWEVAVNGGEPVRASTMAAFAERFAPAGLRPEALTPCYGLAESTLLVAGGGPGRADRAVDPAALERHRLRPPRPGGPVRTVVDCGSAVAGGELRIVDPDGGAVLPDGRVGEIWYRGPGVAPGYFGRPRESVAAFGHDGFLRTGDLGTLDEGRLYVTGRLKDVIVVAGRNLYPDDLEHTVQRVSALFGSGSAFAVPGAPDSPERVVVVQELRSRSRYDIDMPALTAAVQQCLADEFDIRAAAVLLVRPGTVRRTTSGKVERAAMRGLFLRGEIDPLHQDTDPDVGALLTTGGRK